MFIPPFDLSSLFGVLPCPTCNGQKYIFTATTSSKSDIALEEELVRNKLYGEYED
jgi:hypothetical protein